MHLSSIAFLLFLSSAAIFHILEAKKYSQKLKKDLKEAGFPDDDESLERIRTKLNKFKEKSANKLRKAAGLKEITITASSVETDADLDEFLYQGDIFLSEKQIDLMIKADEEEDGAEGRNKRGALNFAYYTGSPWPVKPATIGYYIDSSLSGDSRAVTMIQWAVNFWQYRTCLVFQEV